MGRTRRRGRRGEHGQSLVEFSLVLPVFFLLLFGIVDFGLAFDASIGVSNAAREGARSGTTKPTVAAIDARVRTVAGRLNNSRLTVTVTCKTSTGAACPGGIAGAVAGSSVVVRVAYSYPMLTPIAFGTNIPLSSTAEMRVE